MDKDEILNGPNKEGEWVEAQADPDDPNSTPENTYAYVRRYADGRVVTEYYRRWQEGGPYRTKTSMDAAQEKRFKEQQAAAAKPPEERNNNGRRERWNPQTQRWEDVGAAISTNTAPAPKSEAEQRAEAANAQTAEERARNEAKLNAERDWHEQQGHGRYTHAEWEQKLDKDAAEARANGQQDLANRLAQERLAWEKEKANLPEIKVETVDRNGQRFTTVTSTSKDGKDVHVRTIGPDGKDVAALPDDASKKPIPGDAPSFTPNQQEADLGLTAYARAVRQRTDLSKEQQDQLIREAHGTAQTVISRQTSTINTQENTRSSDITQRGQDMSQTNARLSAANSVYGTALSRAGEDTKYSTGADAMAVAPYYMMLGQAAAQMFGGLQNTPRVQNGPAIQAVQQQGLPTVSQVLATAPGNPVAPAVDPAAAAAAEAARQQQIRANPVFRPTPPVAGAAPSPAPPVPPAQQPQSPGVPGMMMPNSPTIDPAPSPATAPLPPQAQGPNPAINPVTGEPTGLPQAPVAGEPFVGGRVLPQPEPAPVVVPPSEAPAPWQPAPAPSGGAFPPLPVIPRAGTEAGGNVQMAPVPQNPVATALGAGPWQQQPQMQRTGAVGTQLMAADGAYDPASVNDEWLAAGADPAIVAMFGGGRRAVA